MMKENFNLNSLIRPNVKRLKPYSTARDDFKDFEKDMVFLDANENPFNNGVNRYPDPQQCKVKTALSQVKGIPTQNILLGNGSDEILDLIFRVFCEPNQDNVVILPPTYGMYGVLADVNAVEVIKVELDKNFQPRVEEILNNSNAMSKILFLCSPNNPSGNSFNRETIETLIRKFKGIVVIDEAYIDFTNQESWLNRLTEFPNLVVTQTLSKAYGMAGIRLGICYASEKIISTLNKIKPPYNVNQLTQQKALEGLLMQEGLMREVKIIKQQRDLLISKLKAIDFILKIYPTDANFILVKVDDANKRYSQLIEKGVVVRNRTREPLCENCLRLTVGTQEENIKLINVLKELS